MANEIINVENLSVSFENKHVLKDVSFKAYQNEITVILGKSGCGKTTLMKQLLGLNAIQKGSVVISGNRLEGCSEDDLQRLRLQFGVLFQNGALLNSLTVAENVAIPLEQHTDLSTSFIQNLIGIKLRLVGLEDAAYLLPAQLSGGMRKRAALARALALDPPLLFCDEPSAGLDPVTLDALDTLILQLKNQLKMTIILVTHEVSSIFRLADRIVFLDDGQVLYQGELERALHSDQPRVLEFFNKAKGKN